VAVALLVVAVPAAPRPPAAVGHARLLADAMKRGLRSQVAASVGLAP
jgi:hypothetical protein